MRIDLMRTKRKPQEQTDVHYIDDKSVNFGESLLFAGDGSYPVID